MTLRDLTPYLNAMLTRWPLNKPSRALVATGSLLECRFFRAFRIVPPITCCDTGPEALALLHALDRGRYGRTTRSRLRVRDVGIGSGVDVVRVGGTKSGNVDGRRLILGQGEVRCIGRLGVEAARLQSLDLSLVGTGAVAEKPSLTR